MWTGDRLVSNPLVVLQNAAETRDVLRGLVPDRGITWLYGSSMSFKTFVAMSMAAAMSDERPWMGRQTESAFVVYLGAEGGNALHIRRAAAELDAGASGPMYVVQERPQLDTRFGALRLRGILAGLTGLYRGETYEDIEEDAVFSGAFAKYDDVGAWAEADTAATVVCFIDTYSQTSGGDDKANVAAYIKNLRDLIDAAAQEDWRLAFVVIDHATKTGGSYMGSVAKLNDVDSQIEVLRASSAYRAVLHQRKTKDGVESKPLDVELVPFVLEGFTDAYGDPLSTLVVRDGTKAARLAEVADGKAGVLLGLIFNQGGSVTDTQLRRLFAEDSSNEGIKADSVSKAYRRCKETLLDGGMISEADGIINIGHG
ncbi:MAG: hypothetical protein RLZZ387_2616 [Chloroflexota bacterium]